jgi:hypothetical protein
VGVFMTTMPLRLAAGTSTLSTPMPARPITRRLSALAMTLAVTLDPLRITSPSYSPIAAASSSSDRPGL